jgi:predicted TIM-barrel fold metal-dependent hydrolase
VIDCVVHAEVGSVEQLVPHLPPHWQAVVSQTGFRGPYVPTQPAGAPTVCAPWFARGDDAVEGSEPEHIIRVLDRWSADVGILCCDYAVEGIRNPDAAAAVAAAVNDWLVETWLPADERFRASLVLPIAQPAAAAAEIERLAGHPRVVQALLPVRSPAPYGDRRYLPVFEAAVRAGIAVGLRWGGNPGNPPTGTGWPSYFAEEHAGMPAAFQTQLLSLIAEGVFERFSDLRVALLGSGFSWLPAFLWRLDKEWRGMRREVPWVRRAPSAAVSEQVRVGLHPIDAPATELATVLEELPSDDLLMFCTDHPRWQFDADEHALPDAFPEPARARIADASARAFYRLS